MENGIGRPGGRAAGTSFDRYRNTGNTSHSNYNNNYSNFNSYTNNNNNQNSSYQSNNYNHNSSHNSNHSNNQSNSSSNSYNSPTTDLLRPEYSKRKSSSYNLKNSNNNSNNSNTPISNSKPSKLNNNNPGHLALLQQSANAAGKSFADTVQRPTFFVNELENVSNGFFNRTSNQGTPSPTYSGKNSLLAKSSKHPKIQPKLNSKTEFPTLGGQTTTTSLLGIPSQVSNSNLGVFGQTTGVAASKSTAGGFASALTGAPKDHTDSPTAAKLSISQTIVQQSSILITTRKKTSSGGSSKKKGKNLAKELFSLTDSSVLDRNNNQISSESETSPGKTKKDSKKDKKSAKSVKKEAEKSGKIKTSKKKTPSSESDNNNTNCEVQCEHEGNVENQVPSEQSANNEILKRDIGLLWDQELEKKLIRQMRERCHDCFVEEEDDKMITDSEIQEMQEFMQSIKNRN